MIYFDNLLSSHSSRLSILLLGIVSIFLIGSFVCLLWRLPRAAQVTLYFGWSGVLVDFLAVGLGHFPRYLISGRQSDVEPLRGTDLLLAVQRELCLMLIGIEGLLCLVAVGFIFTLPIVFLGKVVRADMHQRMNGLCCFGFLVLSLILIEILRFDIRVLIAET